MMAAVSAAELPKRTGPFAFEDAAEFTPADAAVGKAIPAVTTKAMQATIVTCLLRAVKVSPNSKTRPINL
jgi:hypothetical protein